MAEPDDAEFIYDVDVLLQQISNKDDGKKIGVAFCVAGGLGVGGVPGIINLARAAGDHGTFLMRFADLCLNLMRKALRVEDVWDVAND